MDRNIEVLIGVAVAICAIAIAFVAYRWRQRRRTHRIERQIRDYVKTRYGELPRDLGIHCTDDPLWPVLADFGHPQTGVRHRLRFSDAGNTGACVLTSETEEPAASPR